MISNRLLDPGRGLVVGNYCHDVLIRDGLVMAESLGGASSFISEVLDGLSIDSDYISKVGDDFSYSVTHTPIVLPSSRTTLFQANFSSNRDSFCHGDRILKRLQFCGFINPFDIPEGRFGFGLAVGVGGEITPGVLERMLDACEDVFVDIQSLIRVFGDDGSVELTDLGESGFFELVPRIRVLKGSEEEAPYMDIDVVRELCCVVVTKGRNGCVVYWKDKEVIVPPFPALQVDPTGAGDSFLGGLASGLVLGLPLEDAALLGNFFGSLTVSQMGLPKFNSSLLKKVRDEVEKRKIWVGCHGGNGVEMALLKSDGHEQFRASLQELRVLCFRECYCDGADSIEGMKQCMQSSLISL